jgi:hypothetical protein
MRKEYNDRWTAPLVNPGFTLEEYELQRIRDKFEKEIDSGKLPKNRSEERETYLQAE